MELSEAAREKLAQGLFEAGQSRHRARLIVDVAAQAAAVSMRTITDGCRMAPDGAAAMAALQIALQLVRNDCDRMFEAMLEMAGEKGAPTSTVEVER